MRQKAEMGSVSADETPWKPTLGALPEPGKGVTFRLWAPKATRLAVKILGQDERVVQMKRTEGGVFEAQVPQAKAGDLYYYLVDKEKPLPDPVSRAQPQGVHGPSQVVDLSFAWTDQNWRGMALKDYVLYELHIGTFTPQGTFEAAIEKLDYLRSLGITAVEIMPVGAFPGERNWGYDGVQFSAPQQSYGGPGGLQKLINACHEKGLAVVMDVVYNHLGPEGNYVSNFQPFFSSRYRTPWGDAVNYDDEESPGVRRQVLENALYWMTEYHVDGLRLDAVHGIFDFGARHILKEMAEVCQEQGRRLGKKLVLIGESDLNDTRVIEPMEQGGYGLDAQWSDDFHHALHTLLTGNCRGYLADFGTMADLAKALTEGFVYDWKWSQYRKRYHGSSAAKIPGVQHVISIQNHDQIPNAYAGERLSTLVTVSAQKMAAALFLCAPNTPMLFMGQEYGETAPFHYFTSHADQDLVKAVQKGRKEEFASFGSDRPFPDPQSPETFAQCKLDWSLLDKAPHAQILAWYRDLIALRKEHPCLRNGRKDLLRVWTDEARRWLVLARADVSDSELRLVINLSKESQSVPVPFSAGRWRLVMDSEAPIYGGNRFGPGAPQSFDQNKAHTQELPLEGSSALIYLRS